MSNEASSLRPSSAPRKKKSRTGLYIVIALVVVVALGTGAWLKGRNTQKLTRVTTEKAVVKSITQFVSATGKIHPVVEVKIAPEVAGEIVELPFREGASVQKGELLLRIKSDNYQFQVEQREADLAAARAASLESEVRLLKAEEDFRRSRELFAKSLVSDADLTTARTNFEAAKAGGENALAQIRRAEGLVKQSQDLLEKTTIYAPIDGTISSLSTEVGERVAGTGQYGGAEVMRIADLGNMEVRVSVNENDIVNVKPGDNARITIDAFPDGKFTGTVTEIASAARTLGQNTQEEVTNFQVKIRIAEKEEKFRPGMSANADIETRTVPDVVAVPIQSVTVRSHEGAKTIDQLAEARQKKQRETQGQGAESVEGERRQREQERSDRESLQRVVFVVDSGAVKMVEVETGIADTTHMEIQSGVAAGDEIVSGPFSVITRALKDGMKVRVEKRDTATASAK